MLMNECGTEVDKKNKNINISKLKSFIRASNEVKISLITFLHSNSLPQYLCAGAYFHMKIGINWFLYKCKIPPHLIHGNEAQ
jgi:hypothetical protein